MSLSGRMTKKRWSPYSLLPHSSSIQPSGNSALSSRRCSPSDKCHWHLHDRIVIRNWIFIAAEYILSRMENVKQQERSELSEQVLKLHEAMASLMSSYAVRARPLLLSPLFWGWSAPNVCIDIIARLTVRSKVSRIEANQPAMLPGL